MLQRKRPDPPSAVCKHLCSLVKPTPSCPRVLGAADSVQLWGSPSPHPRPRSSNRLAQPGLVAGIAVLLWNVVLVVGLCLSECKSGFPHRPGDVRAAALFGWCLCGARCLCSVLREACRAEIVFLSAGSLSVVVSRAILPIQAGTVPGRGSTSAAV